MSLVSVCATFSSWLTMGIQWVTLAIYPLSGSAARRLAMQPRAQVETSLFGWMHASHPLPAAHDRTVHRAAFLEGQGDASSLIYPRLV
jgi:hypothetical protein